MKSLIKLFTGKSQQDLEPRPITFEDQFEEFKKIVRDVGKEMPRRYASHAPYICAFDEQYTNGNAKIARIAKSSIHIMYYESEMSCWAGLGVMHIDRTNECFKFQKHETVYDAKEAIERFVDMLSIYADRLFIRLLKEKIEASKVLNPDVERKQITKENSVDAEEQGQVVPKVPDDIKFPIK